MVHWTSYDSALYRSIHGWSPQEHLLVSAVDLLAGGNWQRGGGKGQRPKPTRRPNDTPTRIKPQARTVEEYDEILGWTPPAH